MKELQAKMLDVLDRVPARAGTWRAASIVILRDIVSSNLNATPVQLRRVIRRTCFDDDTHRRVFREIVKMTIDEATGLAGLRRAQEQDKRAVLFNASSMRESTAVTDTRVSKHDTCGTRALNSPADVGS